MNCNIRIITKIAAVIAIISCCCYSSEPPKDTLSDNLSSYTDDSDFSVKHELDMIEEIERHNAGKKKQGCLCKFLKSLTSNKKNN